MSTTPEDVGLASERLSRIDGWMDRLVADGKLAGLSVNVLRRGQLAYSRATGKADLARGTAFDPATIVRIYSMTKPLTSTAIMMLYEEGRFQLDDPSVANEDRALELVSLHGNDTGVDDGEQHGRPLRIWQRRTSL